MKTRNILSVTKEGNKAIAEVKTDFGTVKLKRTFRRHTKEIRELQRQNIYCFEIQGILYWYKFDSNNVGTQYKEPEDFRSETRTTDSLRKGIKVNNNNVELPKVEIKEIKQKEEPKKEEVKEDKKRSKTLPI